MTNNIFKKEIKKAAILTEALPYIKEFNGITVVIKYGGAALVNEEVKNSLIKDIALMKYVGFKPVLVHGGGKDINKILERLNIKSEFKNGLRVTNEETIDTVQMVLAGKLNKDLASELCAHGINAVGLCGKDANLLQCTKMLSNGEDIGQVGEVAEVNTELIRTLLDNDFVPVISPIGVGIEDNKSYNINADYAAVSVAGALKAEKLVFITDVPGLLEDVNDPDSILSVIHADEVREMIADGTISGGMLPKINCCIAGVEAGVSHVHIIDGRIEHCLLLEIFTKRGVGTLIEG
ncbi:MAG: acetylglutamate kinase [Clostridiales bacterium]|nr:acetylglutamate kinase [Clostridiales bacterium]